MSTALDTAANERSTFGVQLDFADENGDPATPNSITWTLTDTLGAVVNGRAAVSVTPASSVVIVLAGLDLAVGPGLEGTERRLYVAWTYDSSTLGSNKPGTEEFSFQVNDFAYPVGLT